MKLMLLFVIFICLAGCAVMDISTLDTAKPMYPDRVKADVYLNVAPNYSSGFFLTDEELTYVQEHDDFYSNDLSASLLSGYRLGLAINERLDIHARYYETGLCRGGKIGIKSLIHHSDNVYHAFLPTITFMVGKSNHMANGENYVNRYSSLGGEFSYLASNEMSRYFTATASARINASIYDQNVFNKDFETKTIVHGGLCGNLRLKISPIYAIFEIGIEALTNHEMDVTLSPNSGMAIGLQF
jgi:hypothetical protein